MYVESVAVIGTMLALMADHQVPSLSVHDSIIVPRRKVYLAKELLMEHYRRAVGITPYLRINPLGALDL